VKRRYQVCEFETAGVLRTSQLFRPRTESRYCDPIFRPRRSIATLSRTIHIGGGFASGMLGEYAGRFMASMYPLAYTFGSTSSSRSCAMTLALR
jgi:hypothetical protein